MNVFFDTSVLVAACEQSHPHYVQARPALLRVLTGPDVGYVSAHSIAELYAALTRLPVQPRIQPVDAFKMIEDNICSKFQTVPLLAEDYIEAVKDMAMNGLVGAKIYDLLLLRCAAKCPADRIYTFNLADFRQLAPVEIQARICMP